MKVHKTEVQFLLNVYHFHIIVKVKINQTIISQEVSIPNSNTSPAILFHLEVVGSN
jgi:hypothetical protein